MCLADVWPCRQHRRYPSRCRPLIRKQSVWSSRNSCLWRHHYHLHHLQHLWAAVCGGMVHCASYYEVDHRWRPTHCYQSYGHRVAAVSRQCCLVLLSSQTILVIVSISLFSLIKCCLQAPLLWRIGLLLFLAWYHKWKLKLRFLVFCLL